MTGPWRTLRVFISSTFRDMHSERDHLVRVVFPELRERCARRRLHLVDVDLRWGVTEEESEPGRVLEICLDEIERCRPFFIGILGERYGWVLPREAAPDDTGYDWIRGLDHEHSITALEIYHGP
jgi:telomerase protein component 1